ncbi:hypothetical protein JL720_7165 [Aureococcus anophagefferens]|nr:hypothetical protein JL720_7165 [Aureococcus anophagefferens]
MLDSTADVLAAAVLATAGVSTIQRVLRGGGGSARARASDCTDTSFAPTGTEWKDDASAEDEGRSRKHLSALRRDAPDGFGTTTSQIADEGGPATHQLVAATVIRTGPRRAGRAIATEPPRRRPRLRPAQLLIQFVVLPRKMGTGRDSLEAPVRLRPHALPPLGVKDAFLFATEAGAPAWLTLGFEHVGSSASLIHLRFDLLFKRDRGVSRSARGPETSRRSCSMDRAQDLQRLRGPLPHGRAAGAGAAPPRRRVKKRVVDDADADDEDEAWEPGRPSMMDLDDDEQEQAAKAKRKLKRRSKKKSAKAKNAAGAAPHAPEQERNAFLERIQAEEVRREQARIAAARPVPPPPNRATGAGDDGDEVWEESDNDDPVEDLIHRERIRERDLLRTPGCLALGRKAFRLEDMPRTAPGRAEVHIKELGFHFVDPLAPIAEKEIVPRPRLHPALGIEGWISITLDDGHLIVELKYLQAMHVKNRMLKKCCYTLYLVELADRLRAEASRETLKTARKNVVEVGSASRAPPATLRHGRARARRRASSASSRTRSRKAAEARGETFVPTPYDETAVDAVVVTAVEPVAPVVSAPAGPPLKALEGMSTKECLAELYAAGVPKKGVTKHVGNVVLRDLVRRLRAGEPAASLKVPRKPKSAEELFCLDKAEQLACRARTPRPSTSIFHARTLSSSQATLVADGAKKVEFHYGKKGKNGTDYLVARWRGLGETDPLRLEFEELARRDVAAAAADELPVDRLQRAPDPGLVNLPTIWPRMRFSIRRAGRRATEAFPAPRST